MSVSEIADPVHARSKLGLATRDKGAEHPETIDARRNLAEAKIAAYIRRTVEKSPPLSAEQRDRLASLLRTG